MNLYLIFQNVNNGYDTYDSAVVRAPNAEAARGIHPNGYGEGINKNWCSTWVGDIDEVRVKLIGKAHPSDMEEGVVLASFNAG